jgi:hypothetical protein
MEQQQLVYRSKQPGKTKKSPGGASVAGAAHACPFFKIKGTCKHGTVAGYYAGIHDTHKPFETKSIGREARQKWGGGKGKGDRGGKGGRPTSKSKGSKGGKGAKSGGHKTNRFTEKVSFDDCKSSGRCYYDTNIQECHRHAKGTCGFTHTDKVNTSTAGGAAAPTGSATASTPKSTNAAQAMALFQDCKARGLTQSETMESVNKSDFSTGTPCVDPSAGEEPPHVPAAEEEMHHEEVPMAAAAINTSTVHLDGGTCESKQLSQVIKSTIMVSTCRSGPYVKLQGLGKQYSSDPSPYSHNAVLEAARIAALAATAALAASF